jgi:hypothetical protein
MSHNFAFSCAFALTGEILTGDSDGNVMVWKGIKVVRVLKGAHQVRAFSIIFYLFISLILDSKVVLSLKDNYPRAKLWVMSSNILG